MASSHARATDSAASEDNVSHRPSVPAVLPAALERRQDDGKIDVERAVR